MRLRCPAVSALVVLFAAAPAGAQQSALREVREGGGAPGAGIAFSVAQPLDAFRDQARFAVGVGAFGAVGGTLALRLDGTLLAYGSEYSGQGYSTSYLIGTLGVGPQLTLGRGPMRLYGFATVGGSLFWTSTSDACGCYGPAYIDVARSTTATQLGGGLRIALGARHAPVALDLGVRDLRNERVRYVPAGGVSNDGGGFTVTEVETPVRLRVFQIGLSIGLR